MKKIFLYGLLFFSPYLHAVELTDAIGNHVLLRHTPQRIVSLLPSITETICVLGACNRLVAVDRYSNWPAELSQLPKVGGGLDPNIEMIVAARPDLVLASSSTRIVDKLKALGLQVYTLELASFDDVQSELFQVAALLGLPASMPTKIWHDIGNDISRSRSSIPVLAQNKKIYFEVDSAPYAAGPDSFLGKIIGMLGMDNIIPVSLGAFPKINPEFVVQQQPDLIVLGERDQTNLADRPGWSSLRAVRQGKVCLLNNLAMDVLVRPGPRMAEGAQQLAACIADKFRTSKGARS